MGGVCSPQDVEEEESVALHEHKDMESLQRHMRAYKMDMPKEEKQGQLFKSIKRKEKAREKLQKYVTRRGPQKSVLEVEEEENDDSLHVPPRARGDEFTRASAERFMKFKDGLEEEKRRSRRPDTVAAEKQEVKSKVKELTLTNGEKPKSEEQTGEKKRSPKKSDGEKKKKKKSSKRSSGESKKKSKKKDKSEKKQK